MAKINLSIPDGMKQEMEEISGMNWSAVAAEAFQEVIHRHNFNGENMNEVKERLLASKAKFEKEMTEAGETSGRDWAKEVAEYGQIALLEKVKDYPGDLDALFALIADDPSDSYEKSDFFETIFGDTWESDSSKHDNPQFCEGFVKGALALFKEAMAA